MDSKDSRLSEMDNNKEEESIGQNDERDEKPLCSYCEESRRLGKVFYGFCESRHPNPMHKRHRSSLTTTLKCLTCGWRIVALLQEEEWKTFDMGKWKRAKATWKRIQSVRANTRIRMSSRHIRATPESADARPTSSSLAPLRARQTSSSVH